MGRIELVGAGLQFESCEDPACCAVLEAVDVGHAHALEGAGADDAAGASGAVEDDGCVGAVLVEDVGDVEGELAVGDAAPAGDAEVPVLLRGAGVHDNELLAGVDASFEFDGVDFGDAVLHLHALAEVLAGDVRAPFGGEVEGGPAVDAAFQDGDAGVAHAPGGDGGEGGLLASIVAEDQGHAGEGDEGWEVVLDAMAGEEAGAGDVGAVVAAGVADVEEGEFFLGGEEGP